MSRKYTKAELEELVHAQLENLNAMHDLLRIVKTQNELLQNVNKRLHEEIDHFKHVQYGGGNQRRRPTNDL